MSVGLSVINWSKRGCIIGFTHCLKYTYPSIVLYYLPNYAFMFNLSDQLNYQMNKYCAALLSFYKSYLGVNGFNDRIIAHPKVTENSCTYPSVAYSALPSILPASSLHSIASYNQSLSHAIYHTFNDAGMLADIIKGIDQ